MTSQAQRGQADSEVVYRDTKGYHHLKNRQESVCRAYRYDETIEMCYFTKRYKKIETNELETKELRKYLLQTVEI